jgi:hypothetical protein
MVNKDDDDDDDIVVHHQKTRVVSAVLDVINFNYGEGRSNLLTVAIMISIRLKTLRMFLSGHAYRTYNFDSLRYMYDMLLERF